MSTPPTTPLKSSSPTTGYARPAEPAPAPSGSGAPKGVARKGVLSVLRPDPHTSPGPDRERVFFGLHVVAEPAWRISVTAACPCGYQRQVNGRARVVQTIEDYVRHKETCSRHTALGERGHAA
ncbi:hypothetical protein AB0G85_34155 [Streptomyces sioyaensis]|uniref:hypothetical protein n=1 Tax=Streptomyces sioyaensis TaxID=67364 RepID=UPI00340957D9